MFNWNVDQHLCCTVLVSGWWLYNKLFSDSSEILAMAGSAGIYWSGCHEAIQFPHLDFVCSGNKELFVVVVNRTKIIWPSIGKLIVIYEFLDWSLVGSPFGLVSKHPRTERSLNVLICTFLPGMIQYAYNQCQTIIYIYTRICLQPLSKFGMWLL